MCHQIELPAGISAKDLLKTAPYNAHNPQTNQVERRSERRAAGGEREGRCGAIRVRATLTPEFAYAPLQTKHCYAKYNEFFRCEK
jgi:hypothetical protein